jgi:glycosyltransferase involved in cell wall biosynthesis
MATIDTDFPDTITPAQVHNDTGLKTGIHYPEDAGYHSKSQLESTDLLPNYKILLLIPAYNEERFIGSVVLKSRKYVPEVLVIDDGSTDSTAEIARNAGAEVLRIEHNTGKGMALSAGFEYAMHYNPDAVVTIDADGQHCPEELPLIVQPILDGKADIVIGSRYLVKKSEVPRYRIWGHRFFNIVTRTASGVSTSDSQSGYRAFSPRALPALVFHSNGFSVESEMQFIARQNGLLLSEVPITIRYTDPPKRSVISQGLSVLNGVMRMVGQYRPLLFFALPGAVLLTVGLIWGIIVVNIYNRTQTLAVGYAMISVLLSIIGMLGLSTGVILHSVRGLILDQTLRRRS